MSDTPSQYTEPDAHLVGDDPEPDGEPAEVARSQDHRQTRVHDHLGQVVRTGDVLEPVAPRHGVATVHHLTWRPTKQARVMENYCGKLDIGVVNELTLHAETVHHLTWRPTKTGESGGTTLKLSIQNFCLENCLVILDIPEL